MCGIVGAVAQRDVAPILLEGLKRLEYRGYDSAGIAILNDKIERRRTTGKVQALSDLLSQAPIAGTTGIAHTRWATHGAPTEANAHPHLSSDEIALVHNGIIENHDQLRAKLSDQGYCIASDTDTELVAHLIHFYLNQNEDLITAVRKAVADCHGAYALGVMLRSDPSRLIAIRSGSPLVIGLGLGENFIASDHLALLPVAQKFIYLEEGDCAEVLRNRVTIWDSEHQIIERPTKKLDLDHDVADRGQYRHYMQKEIFEQLEVIPATLDGRLNEQHVLEQILGERGLKLLSQVKRVQIVACGTSYHAGMVARYWLEGLAGIPCQVEIASEQRYRCSVVEPDTLFVTISQSGETADTLAALRNTQGKGYLGTLAICNVPESSLVRGSDICLMTRAGAEIGVASTKAFTTQLSALLMLTLLLGRHHKITSAQESEIINALRSIREPIQACLALDNEIKALAKDFADKHHALFLGRGVQYPIAREGALKLKEISYIHAEAYPAGELKHGPLALVDKEMPVIVVAPNDELLEKLKSNLQEVRARGGKLYVFADPSIHMEPDPNIRLIHMPAVSNFVAPIVYTIPLQLLSYHVAVIKGTDIDQPRNLAKSVTVE